jgi:hypothetical protein
MFSIIYLLGFVFCLTYLSIKLSRTIIRVKITARFFESLLFSTFWFVTIPYTCITGTFFKSQREFDEMIYDKCVEDQVDKVLDDLKSVGKIEDEEKVRQLIKKEIGTLEEIISRTD